MGYFNNKGRIHMIVGPMFSGKTSTLINKYKRYELGGRRCIMIKYAMDDRYDSNAVVTHDKITEKAVSCRYLYEADTIVSDYDVICVDEIQFYKDADIICDKWANQGKIVVACGLNGTYTREPWPVMSNLFALADNIEFITAVCRDNGNDAVYSYLKKDTYDTNMEIIGGADKYKAVDRQTFFHDKLSTDLHRSYIKKLIYLLFHESQDNDAFLEKYDYELFDAGYDSLIDIYKSTQA